MRRLLGLLLGGIPTSPAAVRALAATMADWRHEADAASSLSRRLRISLVGSASVVRVVAGLALKELPDALRLPFIWRTALVFLLLVTVRSVLDPPERFVDVLSGWDLGVLSISSAFQSVVLVLPAVAFVSEVSGRQSRKAPSIGAFALMAIVVALLVSALPELETFQRHATWAHFANAATPPPVPIPSVYRLLVGAPMSPMTPAAWLYFSTTFVTLALSTIGFSALAYQVRRRRDLVSWLVGLAPVVAVPTIAVGTMVLTGLLSLTSRDALVWLWPIRGVVTLLSVSVMPYVLASYLARTPAVQRSPSDPEVAV